LRVLTKPIIFKDQVLGSVQSAASMATIDVALHRLLRIMLGGGVIALLVSLVVGDMLARRTLRPVASIVSTAQQINAAADLKLRIPYDGPPDELGKMVQTFNETLARLEKS